MRAEGTCGNMKVSLVVQSAEDVPTAPLALLSGGFEDKVRKAAAAGADGLELMVVYPDNLDAALVKAQVEAHGLSVSAISSGAVRTTTGLSLLHRDSEKASLAMARLIELIRFAGRVEAPFVTIGSFRGIGSWVEGDARRSLRDILRDAASSAESNGVRLVIEPLNRYETDLINTAREGLDLIEEIGHPAVGLLLDTFHMNIEEVGMIGPFSEAMAGGRLWHIHVADNNRLSPGSGCLDFGMITHHLQKIGYQGFLSGEMVPRPDPDSAAALTVKYLKGLGGP